MTPSALVAWVGAALQLMLWSTSLNAQPTPDLDGKTLISRYVTGSIYLTPTSLRDLRSYLREPTRRYLLQKSPDPIPMAAATLRTYVDGIYPDLMNPERGISFLQIDFVRGVAYDKRASDPNGSPRKVEWILNEVFAVAVLCDVFLRTNNTMTALIQQSDLGPEQFAASWTEFKGLAQSPFFSAESADIYFEAVSKASQGPESGVEGIRAVDSRSYGELKALLANYKGINYVAKKSGRIDASAMSVSPWIKVSKKERGRVIDQAATWSAFEIVEASKDLRVLTTREQEAVVQGKLPAAFGTDRVYNQWIYKEPKSELVYKGWFFGK